VVYRHGSLKFRGNEVTGCEERWGSWEVGFRVGSETEAEPEVEGD
jgi:hypothetical protein